MAQYLVLIKSNAVKGREADYERWYNDIHLPEILARDGFTGGQQFRVEEGHPEAGRFSHFVAMDLKTDDPEAALAALGEAFASGDMTPTDTLDPDGEVEALFYTPTGAWQKVD